VEPTSGTGAKKEINLNKHESSSSSLSDVGCEPRAVASSQWFGSCLTDGPLRVLPRRICPNTPKLAVQWTTNILHWDGSAFYPI
jgi:hypothetical protein